MDRKIARRIVIGSILIIVVLILFGIIFMFSGQDSKTSSSLSKNTMMDIVHKIKEWPFFRDIKKNVTVEEVHHFVRKFAHFSLYMIAGMLLMCIMYVFKMKERYGMILALTIGILYASLDEFHQWFVPGRDAKVTDVMIDTCGVLIGIAVIFILKKIIHVIGKTVSKSSGVKES